MRTIQNFIKRFFPPAAPLKAGLYHFQSTPDSPSPLRLHLRVEPGGSGVLIINAHTVLHLNQTAAEYVFHIIHQTPENEIGRIFANRYNISPTLANQDFTRVREKINALVHTPDLDPVTFLDIDRAALYSANLSAPYRLDCALTYKQQDDMPQGIAPADRVKQELPTSAWRSMIEKASQAGIPHLVFTGGEPTIREDLVDLILYSENQNMVTGLLTNGLRLSEPTYLRAILQSGLDHIMITLDPSNQLAWKAVRDVVAEDIALTVHLTLTPENAHALSETITTLGQIGVRQLSLSAIQPSLNHVLLDAQKLAAQLGISLVWDLPVPYSVFNPVAIEAQGQEEIPQGAGKAWLYVEPDGDVLPTQGTQVIMGNLFSDPWEQIWATRPMK